MRKDVMVLGTSSGAGKSLITTALCRVLLNQGEVPIPFKAQNMSNNAWVDSSGGEMAFSQAAQAWAAGLEPSCSMNPILLKPKGDTTSEVIHLGQSVGISHAKSYYNEWFKPGWKAIRTGLKSLKVCNPNGRFVIEGAGSPVEMNLQHRDLTNLRIAQFLKANCVLVADIERGGVFAQIIGTLELLKPCERKLIRGIIINRFRGDSSLFDDGKRWIEERTRIPVLGIMPWIKDLFPPEDSLDLINRNKEKVDTETKISVLKLPSMSNFSDFEPLELESSVELEWVEAGSSIGKTDAVIIPGSKQTIKDLKFIKESNLYKQIKDFADNGGCIFGICGGLQMMGEMLIDPYNLECISREKISKAVEGLKLLPIRTEFIKRKKTRQRRVKALWPSKQEIIGFEIHHGKTELISAESRNVQSISEDESLGWVIHIKEGTFLGGTYLHGIFENDDWRREWLNALRRHKGLKELNPKNKMIFSRENSLGNLVKTFEQNIDLGPLL